MQAPTGITFIPQFRKMSPVVDDTAIRIWPVLSTTIISIRALLYGAENYVEHVFGVSYVPMAQHSRILLSIYWLVQLEMFQ